MLAEIENGMRSPRAEEPFSLPQGLLDVDHIMPDRWYENWPLDGEPVTPEEASAVSLATLFGEQQTPRAEAIVRRERMKATFGNLTLVHYGINRSLQHGAFTAKRNAFFRESNLHLNRSLMQLDGWDEEAITRRGRAMFDVALRIWLDRPLNVTLGWGSGSVHRLTGSREKSCQLRYAPIMLFGHETHSFPGVG